MSKFIQEHGRFINVLSIITAGVSLVAVLVLVVLQAYVRWALNKDFTFLGGAELEVLTASAFAFLGLLLFIANSKRD